jgi:CheY-like chemotaxis protein
MNILIAEDTKILQLINSELMNQWGFSYEIAINGREVVDRAINGKPIYDVCLMDIEMPEMSGVEAIKIIREQKHYLPIIALTSNADYKNICLNAGADDFIKKPVEPSLLRKTISEVTTKSLEISYNETGVLTVQEVKPMNHDELQELRFLKSKGLTKLKLVGAGHTFIVHKNIQNKISYDLIADAKELSEFIDRSPTDPGRCHLYKTNLHVTKDLFLPEELEEAIRKEDEIAMKFSSPSEKR